MDRIDSGIGRYKKSDVIGQSFKVHDILGAGGFGVVYLVYSYELQEVCALKTFQDKFAFDPATRERFRREAELWINLDKHPYIVQAYLASEFDGRLCVVTEYIASDERGLNTLESRLQRHPVDLQQALSWSLQFCCGMSHAYSKGVRSHRDIKPSNIMIDQRNTVKITDFGIAGMNRETSVSGISSQKPVLTGKDISPFHTAAGIGFGTPTHMAPEQFIDASICDERSDIYSFGIVMFQMISQGRLPYQAPFPKENSPEAAAKYWYEIFKLHNQASVPVVDSPLFPLIAKCLNKDANRRYLRFDELRTDLEAVLKRFGGRPFSPQKQEQLDAWDWNNKAISMSNIGDKERALKCIGKAIEMDKKQARFWANKGGILKTMSRLDDGLSCCDRALSLNPDDTIALSYKGHILMIKKQFDDALQVYRTVAEIEPNYPEAYAEIGGALFLKGYHHEAVYCYDRSIVVDSRYIKALYGKGSALLLLGKFDNALHCFNSILAIDPLHKNANQQAEFVYRKKGADYKPVAAAMTVGSDIGVVSTSLGSDIFDISLDCYRKVEKQLNESYALDIQRCRTAIIYETCFLYLHYIDRWVFSAFDPQYRDEVMEGVENGLLDHFLSLGGNAQVLHHSRSMIKERERQYASCAGFDYFFRTYLQIVSESCDIKDDRIFASLGTLIIDRLSCLPLNIILCKSSSLS